MRHPALAKDKLAAMKHAILLFDRRPRAGPCFTYHAPLS
jgi:hypothetical protein